MKLLLPMFLLLAASPAWAQVYGADDDPYSQNPFASNMTVPDPTPAPASPAATSTPQPTQPGAAKPPQNAAQAAPATAPQKPAQP